MFDVVGRWLGRKSKSPLKTVAVLTIKLQRSTWKKDIEKYDGYYILKMNDQDQRVVEVAASATESDGFQKFMRGQKQYLIHLVPWIEGTISLEELAKALPANSFELVSV